MLVKPKLQIHISGGAGYVWYHLGIAAYLQKKFTKELSKYNLYYSGESSGAVAALFMLFHDISSMWEQIIPDFLNAVNKTTFKCMRYWYVHLWEHVVALLPKNAYQVASKKYSNIYYDVKENRGVVMTQFSSNEEIAHSTCAGGYIPIFGKTLAYNYRGTQCLDGGIAMKCFGHTPLRFGNTVPTIIIHYRMFRKLPKRWFWLHTTPSYCYEQYRSGYEDAEKNHEYFVRLFEHP